MAAYGQGGRKVGSQNKTGAEVKRTVMQVFLNMGGPIAMVEWALKNKTEFYTKIYAKLIPTDVAGTLDIRDAADLSDDELYRIATGCSERIASAAEGEEEFPAVH